VIVMRRLLIAGLVVGMLVLPATALALAGSGGDGNLVVRGASAPPGVAVVRLVIDGTALGQISTGSPDQPATVIVVDANNTGNVLASGGNLAKSSSLDPTTDGTRWKLVGSDFRFRAADGTYKVIIYGSGADLFAVGQGKVKLQGLPDATPDGWYAIDGGPHRSLPVTATDWLTVAGNG
jgi:hypothetical protein